MIRVVFPYDNNVVVDIPNGELFPLRAYHEILFRQINSYLINKGFIKRNIVDLGAWIGDNTLPWSKMIDGTLYAIDPSSKNCQYIQTLKEINGCKNIEIIQEAISDKSKTLTLTTGDSDHASFVYRWDLPKEVTKIQSTSLDILYKQGKIKDIGYIHLDVEGMEYWVIKGAQTIIKVERPILTYEVHLNIDQRLSKIKNILHDNNYIIYMINEVLPGNLTDCRNMLAMPKEMIEDINFVEDLLEQLNDYNYRINIHLGERIETCPYKRLEDANFVFEHLNGGRYAAVILDDDGNTLKAYGQSQAVEECVNIERKEYDNILVLEKKTSFVIVTGIFDIKRHDPNFKKRSVEKYLFLFKWIHDLNVPTILYIEDHLIDKIKPRDNLIIIPVNLEDLPNYQKINNVTYELSYPNVCYITSHYASVISSKTYLLKRSMEYIKDTQQQWIDSHLIWLDAGIAHIGTIPSNEFIDHLQYHLHNRIVFPMLTATAPSEIVDIPKFLETNHSKIGAGLMIIPWHLIDWFTNEVQKWFNYSIDELKQFCLEEQLIAIMTATDGHRFDYIFSDYWYIMNLIKTRTRIYTPIRNLSYCRQHRLYDLGMRVLDSLLKSIKYARYDIMYADISLLLYEGQIISYYKDKNLCVNLGKMIHYLYHYQPHCRVYFDKMPTLKDNLKYSGIDLENIEGAIDLDPELSIYIWNAL